MEMTLSILQCLNSMNDVNITDSAISLSRASLHAYDSINQLNGINQIIADDWAQAALDALKAGFDNQVADLNTLIESIIDSETNTPLEANSDVHKLEKDKLLSKNDFCDSSKDLLERKGYTYSESAIRKYAHKNFQVAKYMECFEKHKQLLDNRESLQSLTNNQN